MLIDFGCRNIVRYVETACAGDEEPISVVSIVGKSAMDAMNMKTGLVTSLVGQELNLGQKTVLSSDKVCLFYFVN